ncbi:MAG: hypothetical protein O9328_02655 [Rhodobacteraceae bacterium]|nr:hypothetical protein [Paracoccaceae bacterium]
MRASHIRFLQTRLAAMGHDPGPVDGLRGPRSDAAIRTALATLGPLPKGWQIWPPRRRAVACLQALARAEGIDPGPIDGLWGPQTDYAVTALLALQRTGQRPDWRDLRPAPPALWPTEAEVAATFGPHGQLGGFTPPMVKVPSPWPFRIAWNLAETRGFLWAHENTAASVARILQRIHLHYGAQRLHDLRLDIFSGDYAPRLMRGSQSRWSMHAWAIAYDFDDTENRLHWGADRARLARPDYLPFWEIWEAEGWTSLGRSRNRDWMHVQAARLD